MMQNDQLNSLTNDPQKWWFFWDGLDVLDENLP
jgi:hypothetical protein